MRGSGEGRKVMRHPQAGELVWEHATFRHADRPEQRLALYTPTDETVPRVRALLERYACSSTVRPRSSMSGGAVSPRASSVARMPKS